MSGNSFANAKRMEAAKYSGNFLCRGGPRFTTHASRVGLAAWLTPTSRSGRFHAFCLPVRL